MVAISKHLQTIVDCAIEYAGCLSTEEAEAKRQLVNAIIAIVRNTHNNIEDVIAKHDWQGSYSLRRLAGNICDVIADEIQNHAMTYFPETNLTTQAAEDRKSLDRYRYAIHWAAADAWDNCPECRDRFSWAWSRDQGSALDANELATIGNTYAATRP